jgi:hypothetical protein
MGPDMIARKSLKAGVFLETVLILVGLGLLSKAVLAGLETYKFVNNADTQLVEGTVNGTLNHGFTLSVQFIPAASSPTVGFTQDGFVFGRKTGDSVPVLFDPLNPSYARVDTFGALWYKSVLFGVGGFFFLIMGAHLRSERNL